jgi:hypothetical protein
LISNNVERVRIDTSGKVSIGTQTSADFTVNKSTAGGVVSSLVNNDVSVGSYSKHHIIQGSVIQSTFAYNNAIVYTGTESNHPVVTRIGGVDRFNFDTNGNSLHISPNGCLGYGAGAGGTVTQTTSKSTAVTLNKPTGQIITHAESVTSGAVKDFTLFNDRITSTSVVVAHAANHSGSVYLRYEVQACVLQGGGGVRIRLINQHGAPLSEAVPINFIVLAGSTT